MWRENFTLSQVGDVTALLLVETDEDAALLDHETHRKPRAMAVSPGLTVDRRVELVGPDAADMPEIVLEQALFGGNLRIGIEVLHAATTTDAEMRAARRHPRRRRGQHPKRAGQLVAGLAAVASVLDAFPRQCALDENRLAIETGHAACLVVQRFDDSGRHSTLPLRKRAILSRMRARLIRRQRRTLGSADGCGLPDERPCRPSWQPQGHDTGRSIACHDGPPDMPAKASAGLPQSPRKICAQETSV